MPHNPLSPPLTAKNGVRLRVLGVARISTIHQDALSLEDQAALYRRWLSEHTDLPFELETISSRGSGEVLDSDAHKELEAKIASGAYDTVITEDLGRICRRAHAYIICEEALDTRTRLIAINDRVDTFVDGWELGSFFAVVRHEAYNRDTSARIRRTLQNRFRNGGGVQTLVAGYIKPHRHASDAECSKVPAAEPVYEEWFRRLEAGQSYARIADWLNSIGFSVGPAARHMKWDGRMVRRVTFNPILKGVRVRNRRKSERINRTGRCRAVRASASELLERHVPHLAFFDPDRYDRVIALLTSRYGHYRRHGENGRDPRANVSKKRTRWPGQHIYCGVCGRLFVFGGHGQKHHLMCQGAREYKCWNSITVDGPLAVSKLTPVIMQAIEEWPDYDAELREQVRQELDEAGRRQATELSRLQSRRRQLQREGENLMQALRTHGSSSLISADLSRVEAELSDLHLAELALAANQAPPLDLPSIDELRARARAEFDGLALGSPEFGDVMRRLIPRIDVFPYRLLDGGKLVLRASFAIDLSALLSATGRADIPSLRRKFIVDLFDPPQRVAYLHQVAELRTTLTERATAERLGMTITAVQRTAKLLRQMRELGVSDPYQPLRQPVDDSGKFKRHLHARYRFEPLPGYENPQFPAD